MVPPLLFDFLAALRGAGFPIGVSEHQKLTRLLARFTDTSRQQLRGAIAALLGRNAEEVVWISRQFDLHFVDEAEELGNHPLSSVWQSAAVSNPSEVETQAEKPGHAPKRYIQRHWLLLLLLLILILSSAGLGLFWHSHHPKNLAPAPLLTPAVKDGQPVVSQRADGHKSSAPLWAKALCGATGVGLLVLGIALNRLRRRRRRRLVRANRDELDLMPGPHYYPWVLKDLQPELSREDLDEVATILGRLYAAGHSSGSLDVERTLARLLQCSLPPLVYETIRPRRPLIVLLDTSATMRPFAQRIDALLGGLAARGILVECWRFSGDTRQVTSGGISQPLAALWRGHHDEAWLVISTGLGAVTAEGQAADWVQLLTRVRVVAWLHPVARPALWRAGLDALPLRVWPLSRQGLLGAAYELACDPSRPYHIDQRRLPGPRAVTADEVELLKRLVVRAPQPTHELAELLRQHFAPAVPADVHWHLASASSDASGQRICFPIREMVRLRSLLPSDDVTLDARVRRYILKVIEDSRPENRLSVAALRWRLDRAQHMLALTDAQDFELGIARIELRALAASPLVEEIAYLFEQSPQPDPATQRVVHGSRAIRLLAARSPWPLLVTALGAVLILLPPLGPLRLLAPLFPPAVQTLQINSEPPGATVLVDGQRQPNSTPTLIRGHVGSTSKIRLVLPGYDPLEVAVLFTPEERPPLMAKLISLNLSEKDRQADQMLSQARGLVVKNPSQAKLLCRKVMQLYGNSAKNAKVQEAFKLLNSIPSKGDDDDAL